MLKIGPFSQAIGTLVRQLGRLEDAIRSEVEKLWSVSKTPCRVREFTQHVTRIDAAPGDFILCDSTAAQVDVYLPAASPALRLEQVLLFHRGTAHSMVVRVTGGGSINGTTQHSNATGYGSEHCYCTGKEWLTR